MNTRMNCYLHILFKVEALADSNIGHSLGFMKQKCTVSLCLVAISHKSKIYFIRDVELFLLCFYVLKLLIYSADWNN